MSDASLVSSMARNDPKQIIELQSWTLFLRARLSIKVHTPFPTSRIPTVSYHNANMPSFTVFVSLITVALAGVLPRQQSDATGVSRTGSVTYYNTGGGLGACGTTLSDGALTCAVSTTLYDACMYHPYLYFSASCRVLSFSFHALSPGCMASLQT